jgi:putative MATE family efflux protein
LRLAVPAFGALIAEPIYLLTDTAVVGHLGTPQLAGLAVANAVLLALYTIFIFLAYGTTAAVSRLLGAGDEREAAHQAVQSMWLALFLGLGVMVLGFLVADPVIGLIGGAEGAVRTNTLVYLRISLVGVPSMLVVLAGTGYVRGLQDTRTPLAVAVGTAVLNLVVEVVLIYGFDQGIGASALATVLAQSVAALIYVQRLGRAARARGAELRPHPASVGALAKVGGQLLIRTAALRAALAVATAVAARIGTVDLAAHEVAYAVWTFLAFGLDAVAIAGQAIVGRALGAGGAGAARGAGRRMIEWGLGLGFVCTGLVLATRTVLPHLFTSDPEVVQLTAFLLLWVAVVQPASGVAFVLDGLLIGAGDLRWLAWAMIGATAVFVSAASLVLVLGLGIGWLWASLALLVTSRAVSMLVRFHSDRWVVLGATR